MISSLIFRKLLLVSRNILQKKISEIKASFFLLEITRHLSPVRIWAVRLLPQMIRVFLVDDERDIANSLKAGLERKGFIVDAFTDPQEALSMYKQGSYVSSTDRH